jgi:hypothetical protein
VNPGNRAPAIALAAAALAAAFTYPLLSAPGVPAFQQDWLWPISRLQCGAFALTGLVPWHAGGAGSAAAYPEPWWPYLAAGSLCAIAGPHAAIFLFVYGCIFAAGISMYVFCRRCGRSPLGACTAMALYASGPVLFNEIQAGHAFYLCSYALLPAVAALAIPARLRYQWLILGVCLGFASAQQQFFFFASFVVVLVGVATSLRWTAYTVLPAIAVALVFASPQWLLLVLRPALIEGVRPLQHWEFAQSAPLAEAARMIGYIGGYDAARLPRLLRALLWVLPALAVAGAVARIRDRMTWSIAAAGALALLLLWGLYGPLSTTLQWFFTHVPGALVFRELYGFSALLAFAYGFLISALPDARIRVVPRAGVIACCALAAAAGICIATRSFVNVPLYDLGAAGEAAFAASAADAAGARYLTQPALFPQSASQPRPGGYSPFLIGAGSANSALAPAAVYPVAYAAALLSTNAPTALLAAPLRSLAVASVLHLPDVRVVSNVEPALRALFTPPGGTQQTWSVIHYPASMLSVVRYRHVPATLSGIAADADLTVLRGGRAVDLFAAVVSPDPRRSWAGVGDWSSLPPWIYAVPSGIFTARDAAQLTAPSASYVAGDASGTLHAAGCTGVARLDAHFAVFTCGADPVFIGKPPIVVSSARSGATLDLSRGASGSPAPSTTRALAPFLYRISTSASSGSLVVLRQSFDPWWRLTIPARHVKIDGFANGWVLDQNFAGTAYVFYAGALPYYASLTASILVAVAALALAVAPFLFPSKIIQRPFLRTKP